MQFLYIFPYLQNNCRKFEFLLSQGSVATWIMLYGLCSKFHTLSSSVKFWKLVKTWQSYTEFKGGNVFWDTVYIIVRPKASWAGLICRNDQHYHASDCQTWSGQIPGDKPEQGTDGSRKGNVLKRERTVARPCSHSDYHAIDIAVVLLQDIMWRCSSGGWQIKKDQETLGE